MLSGIPMPPATQRRFASVWSELDYLCKKTRYWLYTRKERGRAERYLGRLERVLHALPQNDLAIIREEGWALVCELKGHLSDAIAHRRREIQLMERLHREADSAKYTASTRRYMLQGCDRRALKDRRAILQTLSREASKHAGAAPTGSTEGER